MWPRDVVVSYPDCQDRNKSNLLRRRRRDEREQRADGVAERRDEERERAKQKQNTTQKHKQEKDGDVSKGEERGVGDDVVLCPAGPRF